MRNVTSAPRLRAARVQAVAVPSKPPQLAPRQEERGGRRGARAFPRQTQSGGPRRAAGRLARAPQPSLCPWFSHLYSLHTSILWPPPRPPGPQTLARRPPSAWQAWAPLVCSHPNFAFFSWLGRFVGAAAT
jgi:hypothetical protein